MATTRHVVLVCDLCSAEDAEGGKAGIQTHSSAVDGKATELEACAKCWKPYKAAQEKLLTVGRKVIRKKVA